MRELRYEVMDESGRRFHTASYGRATLSGNRIVRTYRVDIDLRTDKEKEKQWARVEKIKAKRG